MKFCDLQPPVRSRIHVAVCLSPGFNSDDIIVSFSDLAFVSFLSLSSSSSSFFLLLLLLLLSPKLFSPPTLKQAMLVTSPDWVAHTGMYDQRKRGGDGKGRAKPAATAAHLIHFRGRFPCRKRRISMTPAMGFTSYELHSQI